MKHLVYLICIILISVNSQQNKYDYQGAFTKIYQNQNWKEGPNGPLSGSGSMPCRYIAYLTALQHILSWP